MSQTPVQEVLQEGQGIHILPTTTVAVVAVLLTPRHPPALLQHLPWKMMGSYRWVMVRKNYRKHGVSGAMLIKVFKRATQAKGSHPGTVRLRNWNREFTYSPRLVRRLYVPKGKETRYLYFEQFLEYTFRACAMQEGEFAQFSLELFNPDLRKISQAKLIAITKFM